jgi:homoserine kinase type II
MGRRSSCTAAAAEPELAERASFPQSPAMAVYTQLHRQTIEAMVSVFPEVVSGARDEHAGVAEVAGIPQGSTNTTFRVTMQSGAVWYLRVNEGKPLAALAHERDVLAALAAVDLDVVTPRMARSVAGGAFFGLEDGAERRWACLFPALPGRDLGPFEVTGHHAAQVGRFLGEAHVGLRQFPRRRRNPYGAAVVDGWLRELLRFDETATIATALGTTMRDLHRRRRLLPAGLVHGDLFIDNTKWEGTGDAARLVAVFDWEMAGRDHLALDLAIVVCAWAFRRYDDRLDLDDDVATALVAAYQRVRPLCPSERRGLFTELRLAALRFTTSRLRAFETPRRGAADRRYLDYRDFLGRLHCFEGWGERGTLRRLGLHP